MLTFAIVLLGLATLTHSFVVWMHSERRYCQGYEDGYRRARMHAPHLVPDPNNPRRKWEGEA